VIFKAFKNTISFMATIILLFSFVSSGFADSSNSVKIAKDSEKQNVKISERYIQQKGPPDHAPAHGYRAKFKYRYYPRYNVYFDAERGVYFYLKGKNWEVGIKLPNHMQKDLGEFVSLELDTDRPYLYNAEHNKKYSSKQLNSEKKKRNVFTKLWVLLFAR
jgi:hypothetical protein